MPGSVNWGQLEVMLHQHPASLHHHVTDTQTFPRSLSHAGGASESSQVVTSKKLTFPGTFNSQFSLFPADYEDVYILVVDNTNYDDNSYDDDNNNADDDNMIMMMTMMMMVVID